MQYGLSTEEAKLLEKMSPEEISCLVAACNHAAQAQLTLKGSSLDRFYRHMERKGLASAERELKLGANCVFWHLNDGGRRYVRQFLQRMELPPQPWHVGLPSQARFILSYIVAFAVFIATGVIAVLLLNGSSDPHLVERYRNLANLSAYAGCLFATVVVTFMQPGYRPPGRDVERLEALLSLKKLIFPTVLFCGAFTAMIVTPARLLGDAVLAGWVFEEPGVWISHFSFTALATASMSSIIVGRMVDARMKKIAGIS